MDSAGIHSFFDWVTHPQVPHDDLIVTNVNAEIWIQLIFIYTYIKIKDKVTLYCFSLYCINILCLMYLEICNDVYYPAKYDELQFNSKSLNYLYFTSSKLSLYYYIYCTQFIQIHILILNANKNWPVDINSTGQ